MRPLCIAAVLCCIAGNAAASPLLDGRCFDVEISHGAARVLRTSLCFARGRVTVASRRFRMDAPYHARPRKDGAIAFEAFEVVGHGDWRKVNTAEAHELDGTVRARALVAEWRPRQKGLVMTYRVAGAAR